MNKTISLPHIRKQNSDNLKVKVVEINSKQLVSQRDVSLKSNKTMLENEEQANRYKNQKIRSQSLLYRKINKETASAILQPIKQHQEKKYGISSNGKIRNIQESESGSRALTTERSLSTQLTENIRRKEDKNHISKIKKQLNELTSSGLILKKQIRTIEGHITQIKQQISTFVNQLNPTNSKIQQKMIEVEEKMVVAKYENQVLKGMRQRMRKIKIYLQKKVLDARQQLDRCTKRAKVLGDRSAAREQSLNKNKFLSKKVSQKQKQKNAEVQLQVKSIQKKLKQFNDLKNSNLKLQYKNLTQAEYHYQVHKHEQNKLRQELLANHLLNNLLEAKWQSYSIKYKNVQKAGKLIEIHSLKSLTGQFKLKEAYFDSFETKIQLQKDIQKKENKLKKAVEKNGKLKVKWDEFRYKQIEERQRQIDQTALQIKTGKIQEKKIIEDKHREMMQLIRKKMQAFSQKTKKMLMIKDWIVKIQKTLEMDNPSKVNLLQDRLLAVINYARTEIKIMKK